MEGLHRHDLVWLDPDTNMTGYVADIELVDVVSNWIQQSWPLVVARQTNDTTQKPGLIQLGITLPSAPARTRVSVCVPHAVLISYARPLLLKYAITSAPQEWSGQLSAVDKICTANSVKARVYGSLSMQAFTKQNYLDSASDVDVLFECSKATQLHKFLYELQALAEQTPHLDGEILAPNGWAVAWSEVAAALNTNTSVKLLAKSYSETRLLSLDQLFEQQLSATA